MFGKPSVRRSRRPAPSLSTTSIPWRAPCAKGDWKLVWKASLPQKIELFNLAKDKSEQADVAAQNPDKVGELQARITDLAGEMAPPLLMMEALRLTFFVPPVTPDPSVLFSIGD
jgi:hypothetical protein